MNQEANNGGNDKRGDMFRICQCIAGTCPTDILVMKINRKKISLRHPLVAVLISLLVAVIYACSFIFIPVVKSASREFGGFAFRGGIMWLVFYAVPLLLLLFLAVTFYKYTAIVIESAEIKRLAITDCLTSLYTHRYFRFLIEHTVNKALTFGNKCSLIILKILNIDRIIKEIDFNKGQAVQLRISKLVKAKLAKDASGAFLGMGEFGILMPKIGLYEALGIAGSLRNNIKNENFGIKDDELRPVTAIGVSEINRLKFPKTGTGLMRSARAAMGRAKETGRNKIFKFNAKIDSSVFEPNIMEKEIRQRLDDEFNFLAIGLEERNKELEDLLRQLSITQRDLERVHFETLRSLITALEEKDPCSAGHSERVGAYCERIGKKLGFTENELMLLKQAAILHDIGKIGIPQDILRKEDRLTTSERYVIELHPEFSVRILKTSKYFSKMLPAIQGHHERLDGSGYPRALRGNQIPLEAQIISVVDVFDALSTDRPYRKSFSFKKAIDDLVSRPEQYNRTITLALKSILEEDHKLG